MYRLAAPLGRVQTALPNCYGRGHQGLYAGACVPQAEGGGNARNSRMMWFMTGLGFTTMTKRRGIIQTPLEPRPSRCAATSQNRLPFGRRYRYRVPASGLESTVAPNSRDFRREQQQGSKEERASER